MYFSGREGGESRNRGFLVSGCEWRLGGMVWIGLLVWGGLGREAVGEGGIGVFRFWGVVWVTCALLIYCKLI